MKARLLAGAAFAALMAVAYQQSLMDRFRQRSIDSEKAGLAEPFKGVTANGTVEPGLFAVKPSGVSTEPARKSATAFLAALTEEQRKKTMFAVDDPEWRKWMNQHFYVRQGVSMLEMSQAQKDAAFSLLGASLSPRGLQLARDIMKLNTTLAELNNNDFEQYGEGRYYLTMMGTPVQARSLGLAD